MGIELTKEALDEMLGPRTDISSLNNVQAPVTGIAFELYRETTIAAALVSHIYESVSDGLAALFRDQAIKAGLGVRIAKYMGAVLALLSDAVREHREVIMTLNRCITESAMNLKFFVEQAQPADYDEFVKSSLRAERDQRKLILRNIEDRGSELSIEKRMLHSIERTLKRSGINDPSELENIPKRKDYKKILEAIGLAEQYPLLQGVPSHSVHGTWVDLLLHHLEENGAGFVPKPDSSRVDARLLLPVCLLVLDALRSYLVSQFPRQSDEIAMILERIEDLIVRIETVDALHESRLHQV